MIIDETRSGPMRRKGTAGLRRFGGEGEYEDIDRQIKEEDNDPSNRQQPPGRGLLDSDTDDDAPGSSAQHRRPALPPLPLTRLGSLFSFSVDPAPE